jgi:hypothetical protein
MLRRTTKLHNLQGYFVCSSTFKYARNLGFTAYNAYNLTTIQTVLEGTNAPSYKNGRRSGCYP